MFEAESPITTVKEKEILKDYTVKVSFYNPESRQTEVHWESSLASTADGALTSILDNYGKDIDSNHLSQLNVEVFEGKDNKGATEPAAVLHPKAA